MLGLTGPIATKAFVSPATVNLGSAANFAILSESGITNVHTSTINGNIGSSPIAASAMDNVFCSEINGTIYGVDATYTGSGITTCFAGNPPLSNKTLVDLAVFDMEAAYTNAAGRIPDETGRAGGIIGGETFLPGIYRWNSNVTIATNITLSGGADDVWIFQVNGTLDLATGKNIVLTGGAQASNVFWQVTGATTLLANSTFNGTVLEGGTPLALQNGAILNGRAFSKFAVTLIANTISIPTVLHLRKTVTNNNGGTALNTAWTLTATGTGGSPTNLTGTTPVDSGVTFRADTYTLAESGGPSGYTASTYSCVKNGGGAVVSNSITLATGDNATCTITNDDVAPSLHLRKIVTNNSGGTALNTAWTLTATGTGGSPTNLTGTTPVDSGATFAADTYTLTESVGPSGYTASTWVCVGGTQIGSTVTIANGDNATCTITNDDNSQRARVNQGTINVVKTVINDNGGTKTVADFPLFVNGAPVTSGVTNSFPATGNDVYTVTETNDSSYTRTFSGDCDSNGQFKLNSNDAKFCIMTNNDNGAPVVVPPVPPLIDVVKVPNPLALPAGPGLVTYTYTLRNIGTVPVTNVTMVGDSCRPIVLGSGDTNTDARLDVSETWVYHCSTTLSETHTNTVVATGWANGLSAVDIASATVVVGLPVVPPLIHVTKVPSPLALVAGGGMVTYTEKVTNPGLVALSNVRLADDKCSPLVYISGDTNRDSKLDTTESWTYTCRSKLTQTTTNTVTASGEANGLSVRDFAVATVVVASASPAPVVPAVPKLPNTGLPPDENNAPWQLVMLSGIVAASILLVLSRRKKTT